MLSYNLSKASFNFKQSNVLKMSANVSPWKAFLISSSVFKDKVRAYQLYSLMAYHMP
jgi:hypothetical protein